MEFVVLAGDTLQPAPDLDTALELISGLHAEQGQPAPKLYRCEPVQVRVKVHYQAELVADPHDEAPTDPGAFAPAPPLPGNYSDTVEGYDPASVIPLEAELPMNPVNERSGFHLFGGS